MKIVTLLFILFLSGANVFSQTVSLCGTKPTPQQVARDKANLSRTPAAKNAVPQCCIDKTLSLTFWIVKDSAGNVGSSPGAIATAVAGLNTYFTPICLSFAVCDIKYIDDWNYDYFFLPDERDQLHALYQTPKTINVYLVTTIENEPGSFVGGLGTLPPGSNTIWITHSRLDAFVFAHEMGHFLGLYHTHDTEGGAELANGSNCATTGDLVCDTPADPGGNASADCQLSPYTRDPNGDWYVPPTNNIMSYYGAQCACKFTTQQFERMCQLFYTYRSDLW